MSFRKRRKISEFLLPTALVFFIVLIFTAALLISDGFFEEQNEDTSHTAKTEQTSGGENTYTDYGEPLFVDPSDVYLLAEKYGAIYGVDPCLIMAVVKNESAFNAHAYSTSDAIGLMQIKMSTYGDISHVIGAQYSEDALYDPETNIHAGTYYLSWLSRQLDGINEVIVAYNYGIGNVKRMLENAEYSEDGITLIYDKIPSASARRYLIFVTTSYEEYKAVYGEN